MLPLSRLDTAKFSLANRSSSRLDDVYRYKIWNCWLIITLKSTA